MPMSDEEMKGHIKDILARESNLSAQAIKLRFQRDYETDVDLNAITRCADQMDEDDIVGYLSNKYGIHRYYLLN